MIVKTDDQKFKDNKHYVKTVSIRLNPQDNGGESVLLEVDYYDNGDDENNIYTNIHLITQCYGIHTTKIDLSTLDIIKCSEVFNELANIRLGLTRSVKAE